MTVPTRTENAIVPVFGHVVCPVAAFLREHSKQVVETSVQNGEDAHRDRHHLDRECCTAGLTRSLRRVDRRSTPVQWLVLLAMIWLLMSRPAPLLFYLLFYLKCSTKIHHTKNVQHSAEVLTSGIWHSVCHTYTGRFLWQTKAYNIPGNMTGGRLFCSARLREVFCPGAFVRDGLHPGGGLSRGGDLCPFPIIHRR